MAKRPKRRAVIQGRKLVGKKAVSLLGNNIFVYRKKVYEIDQFPPEATVNLDKIEVEPVGMIEERPPKKKKPSKNKRCFSAFLYSNAAECPDVKTFS